MSKKEVLDNNIELQTKIEEVVSFDKFRPNTRTWQKADGHTRRSRRNLLSLMHMAAQIDKLKQRDPELKAEVEEGLKKRKEGMFKSAPVSSKSSKCGHSNNKKYDFIPKNKKPIVKRRTQ
mgnify:FL=1